MRLPPPDRWCRGRIRAWLPQSGSRHSGRNRAASATRRMWRSEISMPLGGAWRACRAPPSGFGPACGGSVIAMMRVDPTGSGGAFLLLPERRVGLQVIHQELRRCKCRLPVLRGRQHQHDIFARCDAADAVNDRQSRQRPARHRGFGMARDFGLRHFGIMFERQRRDRLVALAAPANAAEADDGSDVGAALGERSDLPRDVEIGFLNADGHIGGHGSIATPVFFALTRLLDANRYPLRSQTLWSCGLTAGAYHRITSHRSLATRHGREKGNLAGARNHGIRFDVGVVDRGANHLWLLEGIGVSLAAPPASRSD